MGRRTEGKVSSRLVRDLERDLLFGNIRPGAKLPAQRILAERYGVSRESVREAVTTLQSRGLVDTYQGGGSFGRNLLAESFQLAQWDEQPGHELQLQVMEMRAMLEGEAAYFAAQRASDEELQAIDQEYARMLKRGAGETTLRKAKDDLTFHMLIADSSHNLLLISFSQVLYTRFFNAIYGVLSRTLQKAGRYPPRIGVQHAQIHQALMARDADGARRAAIDHILYTKQELERV